MGIKYNGSDVQAIYYNGFTIAKMMNNGNTIWTPPAGATLFFFDDFNRTTFGTAPTFGANYWGVSRSEIETNMYKPAYGNSGYAMLDKPTSGNFRIEAEITRTSTSGIIGFYIGTDNPGSAVGTKPAIVLRSNMVSYIEAGYPNSDRKYVAKSLSNNVAYKLRVDVFNHIDITVYLDDVEMFTETLPGFGLRVGLFHHYCYQYHRVDNLAVYEL